MEQVMSKEIVTKVEEKPVAVVANNPYADFIDEVGSGFEDIQQSELSIPFLAVLQPTSPQVNDESLPDVRAGMLFNTVTREAKKEIIFVPVHKTLSYMEWTPRDKQGGLIGSHEPQSDIVVKAKLASGKTFGKLTTPDGNELVETHYLYGLILDAEGTSVDGFAVMPFKSTHIKAMKNLMTSILTLKGKPPMFVNRLRIKTSQQKNEKGTFYVPSIEPFRKTFLESLINVETEGHLLREAVDFRKTAAAMTHKDLERSEASVSEKPDLADVASADGVM